MMNHSEKTTIRLQLELNRLRDEARALGYDREADQLWLSRDVSGLRELVEKGNPHDRCFQA